ncbi:MAG TPA: hypothetical protein PK239_14135 [Chitinophagales bacterium]|nr:hypothetical protein [Chitinophagales bacterium]
MTKLSHVTTGVISGQDWIARNIYTIPDINSIDDTKGAGASSILTAIPSPFARLHLFETAFTMVQSSDVPNFANKTSNHEGFRQNSTNPRVPSRYHEMVSQCLDVWEIMFRFTQISAALKAQGKTLAFVPYNIQTSMNTMQSSINAAHKNVANTVSTFLTAGMQTANFNLLPNGNLYFITIDGIIIGCTSPLTLFFTPEDLLKNLSNLQITLNRSDGSAYFTTIVPLHKRDFNFQEYVHRFISAFVKNNPTLTGRIKPFFDYTQDSLNYLQQSDLTSFNNLSNIYILNYGQKQFNNDYNAVISNGNQLQSIGIVLYEDKNVLIPNSGFFIDNTKLRAGVTHSPIPMVLVGGKDFAGWQYWTQPFNNSNVKATIPYSDPLPLDQRIIPGVPQQYPCLYVNDFLEDTLVILPYANDGTFFFNGNLINPDSKPESYLLPVKDAYFEYFSISDLMQGIKITRGNGFVDGKMQGYVEVSLVVPLKGGSIQLERKYIATPSANNKENLGNFQRTTASLAVFPFVKAIDETGTYKYNDLFKVMVNSIAPITIDFFVNYKTILFDNSTEFQQGRVYNYLNRIPRNDTTTNVGGGGGIDVWTVENTHFDYVKLQLEGGNSGLLIPKWIERKIKAISNKFTAAIDFGTTNTHIELLEGDIQTDGNGNDANTHEPLSFTNKGQDCVIGYLGEYTRRDEFFIPTIISGDIGTGKVKFPTRTTTIEQKNLNSALSLFSNISICFLYSKLPVTLDYSLIVNNHKWSIRKEDQRAEERVKAIFEELLLLLRTKILLKHGDPSKVNLVWFYPLSMTKFAYGILAQTWSDYYKKIFIPSNGKVYPISESEAPYYYISGKLHDLDRSSVLSIDIGGGTTDYVFFSNDIPEKATSVYFGANILYGTAYVKSITHDNQNRLMIKHLSKSREKLNALSDGSSTKNNLIAMFSQFNPNSKSVDFINFLFTNDYIFKLTETLRNDGKDNMLFLLYYGAIIYHAAQMMLLEKIKCPQYIFFSGNGSRILNILDSSLDKTTLNEFTKKILCNILEDANNFKSIKAEIEKPKEATCKGGIFLDVKQKTKRPTKFIIAGDNDNSCRDKSYEEVLSSNDIKQGVKVNVMNYVDLFIKLSKDLNFRNSFNIQISDYDFIRSEFEQNTLTYIDNGINLLRKDEMDNSLEETLFFYPFIGAIYALGFQLEK